MNGDLSSAGLGTTSRRVTELTKPARVEQAIAAPQLDMLRGITRQMATSEDFETVLQSIVNAPVERGQAVLARIFLLLKEQECAVCRALVESGQIKPSSERVLHLVAEGGSPPGSATVFHRVPLDSKLPVAEIARTR